MKKIFIIITLFYLETYIHADKINEAHWEPLRVNKLLPQFVTVPALEFALPEDYVCFSFRDIPGAKYFDGYIWGPKEVVLDLFENGKLKENFNPSKPVLMARIVPVVQEGNGFLGENQLKQDPLTLKFKKINWGEHPVLIWGCAKGREIQEEALIGLNHENLVLGITLIPTKKKRKENDKFWETFLQKTRPLSFFEASKSRGQDLKQGETLVELQAELLKVVAEQRKSDGKLFIASIPCTKGISFNPQNISSINGQDTNIAAYCKGKIIKLKGTLITGGSAKCNIHLSTTINVMLKEVDEFSVSQTDLDSHPEIQVFNQAS